MFGSLLGGGPPVKEIGRGLKNGKVVTPRENQQIQQKQQQSMYRSSGGTLSSSSHGIAGGMGSLDSSSHHQQQLTMLRSINKAILQTQSDDDWANDDFQDSRLELKATGHNLVGPISVVCAFFVLQILSLFFLFFE